MVSRYTAFLGKGKSPSRNNLVPIELDKRRERCLREYATGVASPKAYPVPRCASGVISFAGIAFGLALVGVSSEMVCPRARYVKNR